MEDKNVDLWHIDEQVSTGFLKDLLDWQKRERIRREKWEEEESLMADSRHRKHLMTIVMIAVIAAIIGFASQFLMPR